MPTPPLPTILIDNGVPINNHSPYVYVPSRLNPADVLSRVSEPYGSQSAHMSMAAKRAPLSPVVESPAGLVRELGETLMMMTHDLDSLPKRAHEAVAA